MANYYPEYQQYTGPFPSVWLIDLRDYKNDNPAYYTIIADSLDRAKELFVWMWKAYHGMVEYETVEEWIKEEMADTPLLAHDYKMVESVGFDYAWWDLLVNCGDVLTFQEIKLNTGYVIVDWVAEHQALPNGLKPRQWREWEAQRKAIYAPTVTDWSQYGGCYS
jgi:hypothetical protein